MAVLLLQLCGSTCRFQVRLGPPIKVYLHAEAVHFASTLISVLNWWLGECVYHLSTAGVTGRGYLQAEAVHPASRLISVLNWWLGECVYRLSTAGVTGQGCLQAEAVHPASRLISVLNWWLGGCIYHFSTAGTTFRHSVIWRIIECTLKARGFTIMNIQANIFHWERSYNVLVTRCSLTVIPARGAECL